MGELLSEVDLQEISERCDQVETIVGPPGTQGSAEEWCYLLRSHEISPLCDEAQCDIRRLIAAYEALRARLESAEAGLAAVHAHLRSGHLKCAYVGISPRLCSCGDCGALAAALGAAGEKENADGS